MVQSICSNVVISPEEMHQKTMLKEMYSYDKDSKLGLSKTELSNYISDKEIQNSEVPEFAKKLMERFAELDKDKDGKLSDAEVNSLSNNRGLWQVNQIALPAVSAQATNTLQSVGAAGLLHNNIQELAQKGYNSVKNNAQLKAQAETQAENIIHKIM